jgi:hypothetical protein
LYGKLGCRDELATEVIPELYKHLMDYDSAIVRGRAVDAVTKILERNRGAVPEGMIDVLTIQLCDPYAFVHKRAVRAAQFCYTSDVVQATELCNAIAVLDRVYADDAYFGRETMRALIHIAKPYPELLLAVMPAVVRHAQSKDVFQAMDAVEELTRVVARHPSLASLYVREVVGFIKRFPGDMVQHYALSARVDRYLDRVMALPRAAIRANLTTVQEAVMTLAAEHGWEALRLVWLVLTFEFLEEAAALAAQIGDLQPPGGKYEPVRRHARAVSLLAGGESTACQGNLDGAIELFREARELLEGGDEDDTGIEDAIRALSVADRVARDLERS